MYANKFDNDTNYQSFLRKSPISMKEVEFVKISLPQETY